MSVRLLTIVLVVGLVAPAGLRAEEEGAGASGASARSEYTLRYRPIYPSGRGQDFGAFVTADAEGEHRFFFDTKRGLYYGYDVELERSGAPPQLLLTLRPSSPAAERKLREMWPRVCPGCPDPRAVSSKAQRFPPPRVVAPGDKVVIDLLADERSGDVVSEEITVAPIGGPTAAGEPQDFRAEDVALHVEAPVLLAQDPAKTGTAAPLPGTLTDASVSGPVIWLALPGHGRAFFSLVTRPGYSFRKLGVASGNHLRATLDGVRYEWRTRGSIVSPGDGDQAWNLWVLHDPAFRPASDYDVLGGGLDERLKTR